MKNYTIKNFGSPRLSLSALAALLVLLAGGGGAVLWAQQFMTLGCDLSNPIIDPYLMAHSVYADNTFYAWNDSYSPKSGIVGTAGTFRGSTQDPQLSNEVAGGSYVFQSSDGGYFRTISRPMPMRNRANVYYYDGTPPVLWGNGGDGTGNSVKLSIPPYSDLDNATINAATGNLRTRAEAANYGKFRPRFPRYEDVSTKFNSNTNLSSGTINPGSYGNLTVANNTTVYMNAGTYYFNGSVNIGLFAKLLVKPVNGSYKTVIYAKEKFVICAGDDRAKTVGGTFAPEGFSGSCGVPQAASGQILVIAFGTGTEDRDRWNYEQSPAAILIGSNSSVAVGTFIAPRGGIFIMCGGTILGQLLAKDLNFSFSYNNPTPIIDGCSRACPQGDVFQYVQLNPPEISVNIDKTELLEDKNWNGSLTAPTYVGGYPWSADKNKDYIATIKVQLNEKYDGNEPLKINYSIIGSPEAGTGSANIKAYGSNTPPNNTEGGAGRPQNYSSERAFLISAKLNDNELTFNKGDIEKDIRILVIDNGVPNDDSFFNLVIKGSYSTQSCEGGSGSIAGTHKITIKSDDPLNSKPTPPTISQKTVFEHYDGLGIQDVGTLSTTDDAGDSHTFKIIEARDEKNADVTNYFTISGSELRTTANYRADYEGDQQKITVKITADDGKSFPNSVSDTATLTLNISPWNDKPFTAEDQIFSIEEEDESRGYLLIPIVNSNGKMDNAADDDLPESANRQKIAELTKDNKFPTVQKNAAYGNAQNITTNLGATVTIENGNIKYDFANATGTGQDFFYYTAIDTAQYSGYKTDIFVKSVKVTIALGVNLAQDAFYYDKNADGKVDSVIVKFKKPVESLNTIDFSITLAGENVGNPTKRLSEGDNTQVVLIFNSAPQDVTFGSMLVTIDQPELDEPYTIPAKDRTAPVVVSAKCVQSLSGERDIITLTLSEDSKHIGNIPFKFVTGGASANIYEIGFDEIKIENRTVTLIVREQDGGKIQSQDSVFINFLSTNTVKDDAADNEQTNPANKRVPFVMEAVAKMKSAIYFDTDEESDGYIDEIEFDFGVKLTRELAQEIIRNLEFSNTRAFSDIELTTITNTGFKISVKEEKTTEKYRKVSFSNPRTSVFYNNIEEKITLTGRVGEEPLTIEPGGVNVKDGIAPVIWYAEYDIEKSILDVVFSEAVKPTSKGNPYLFWDESPEPGQQFTMTFTSVSPDNEQPDARTLRYHIESTSIPYPVNNDKIYLVTGGYVRDTSGEENGQDYTVRAPIILKGGYPNDLTVHVIPNPLPLVNSGGKRQEPGELDDNLADYYSIPGNKRKGAAVILETKGPISDIEPLRGFFRIIDNTGNAVTDDIDMEFSVIGRGNVAGVGVWDGKNRSGRNVGAGTYLALVQVEIKFDDGEIPEVHTFRKLVAVSAGKTTKGR